MIDRVTRLGSCHVMGNGTHAANSLRDTGHFLYRTALAEFLKTAQLGDDHVGILQTAFLVQEEVDTPVTLEPRDRIDRDFLV